ncbi:MAG: hypothetical protein LBC79_10390 [Deltaproteobacteria bacterium]|jgi:hypothetical protein|nr:hypothetical protein [Deltaproteobacteria bacterium]
MVLVARLTPRNEEKRDTSRLSYFFEAVICLPLTPQNHEKYKKKSKKFWKNSHENKFVNGAMRFFRRGLFSPPWTIVGDRDAFSPGCHTLTPETPC